MEAHAAELLRECNDDQHYRCFREMTEAYFAAFEAGDKEAIASMIDFYGGPGTYAAWPQRVRAYAVVTTPVNIRDWASAYGFPLPMASLAAVAVPTLVMWGGASHPAAQRANALIAECMACATPAVIERAAHFMILSHPSEMACLIADHVHRAEVLAGARQPQPVASGDVLVARGGG